MKLLKNKKTTTLVIALLTIVFSLTAFLAILGSPVGHADAASIEAPTCDIVTYNCAVAFNWKVGKGGDDLYYAWNNGTYYDSIGSATYTEVAYPATSGYKNCTPTKTYWKSYSTTNKTFSSATSTLTTIHYADHDETTFARDCRYAVRGMFDNGHWGAGVDLPTNYDNSALKWKHGGDKKCIVKATVAYNGYVGDFEINIPVLGYIWAGITIGEYEFQMRTGPTYLYFRAVSSGIRGSGVYFGYALLRTIN